MRSRGKNNETILAVLDNFLCNHFHNILRVQKLPGTFDT